MCLILLAWKVRQDFPLVLAANRDEYYSRPSLPIGPWSDQPDIFGGRDLQAGGSWLACHRDGRFAAVTNVRQGQPQQAEKSRGELLSSYFNSNLQAHDFIESISIGSYGGFNLLLGDEASLWYLSNCNGEPARKLSPGIYGLSNHQLDTPWPKLVAARNAFTQTLDTLPEMAPFFHLLADRELAADADLPQTGVSLEAERMLSAIFVSSPHYGTRASTVMLKDGEGNFTLLERSFGPEGRFLGEKVIRTTDDNLRN